LIAALLMLAQIAPVQAAPKPIATTVAAIRANPKRFDGQVVRIHGWVHACQRLSCAIFERAGQTPEEAGKWLSIAADPKFDAIVKPLLPTYVEFDARVDATCIDPRVTTDDKGNQVITVCADRAPDLTIVSLRSVVSPEPPEIEN